MNKLFIGLLVVAAGAGVYFFILKKKEKGKEVTINKEWVIGKWKADAGKDSAFSSFRYELLKNGGIVRSLSDSAKADTLHYEWSKAKEFILKSKAADSSGKVFAVIKLTQDSLQLQSNDSSLILFTRLK
jgi:hypothetical protein